MICVTPNSFSIWAELVHKAPQTYHPRGLLLMKKDKSPHKYGADLMLLQCVYFLKWISELILKCITEKKD